jgi:predicted esterase
MKLLVLHGFIQNGEVMRTHLAELFKGLPAQVECLYPNAPHTCSEESVRRLLALTGGVQEPPNLCWWNATDDGHLYRGLDDSLALLRQLTPDGEPFGLLGFSQGAVFSAALAALAECGEFPRPSFAVMVAGRVPRATLLQPRFAGVLSTPSLHVWGERDAMAREQGPQLVEKFDPQTREVLRWNGPHVLPSFGPTAEELLAFIRKRACI